jgi:hypothetical protein
VRAKPAAAALICAVIASVPAVGVRAAPTPAARARGAIGYLADQQKKNGSFEGSLSPVGTAADAIVAMVAARRGRGPMNDALDHLRAQVRKGNASGIGLKAKVVLAAVAAGANPKRFGGTNLIKEIKDTVQSDGRFGGMTPAFDHALALLALEGTRAPVPEEAVAWLADAQCDDGGWQFDEPAAPEEDEHCLSNPDPDNDFFQSDTNTTALAVQAFAALGEDAPVLDADPFAFFGAIRDEVKNGWGYTWDFTLTDANSTALVLQAYASEDRDVPAGARKALSALQWGRCSETPGAFAFTWLQQEGGYARDQGNVAATVAAVPGLLGVPLPVEHRRVRKGAPRWRCKR